MSQRQFFNGQHQNLKLPKILKADNLLYLMDLGRKVRNIVAAGILSTSLVACETIENEPGLEYVLLGSLLGAAAQNAAQSGNPQRQRMAPGAAILGENLTNYGLTTRSAETEVTINDNSNNNQQQIASLNESVRNYNQTQQAQQTASLNTNTTTQNQRTTNPTNFQQGLVDEEFRNSRLWLAADKSYAFAYNYNRDFNNDGRTGPNENVGIKNTFKEDEEFRLLFKEASNRGIVKGTIDLEVYSPRGEVIYKAETCYGGDFISMRINSFNTATQFFHIDHIHKENNEFGNYLPNHTCNQTTQRFPLLPFFVEKGGYGNYKAVWKINNEYRASNEFEIVPSLEKTVSQ